MIISIVKKLANMLLANGFTEEEVYNYLVKIVGYDKEVVVRCLNCLKAYKAEKKGTKAELVYLVYDGTGKLISAHDDFNNALVSCPEDGYVTKELPAHHE